MVTTTKSTKALAVILALLVGMVFSFAMTANANAATASQKAAKAADWAVKQANTKGICMGTGSTAHKAGCAVCKTNAKKKGVVTLPSGLQYRKKRSYKSVRLQVAQVLQRSFQQACKIVFKER